MRGYSRHLNYGFRTVQLSGLEFADISADQCVNLVVREKGEGRGGWIITANTDFLWQAHNDARLASLYKSADIVVADGMPVIWASRLQGSPLVHGRVCGSDLIFSLPAACARAGLSIFLLGGIDDIADRTESTLTSLFPGLKIAGKYSPPFGFEKDPSEYATMKAVLREAQPDVVLVALGAPKSELLIEQLRESSPNSWWMGVGAAFEFACGARKRAPQFMQRTGTEWLYRMAQDPARLARRYLGHNLPYLRILLSSALRVRLSG
jgi:N-acetylglucosaminyldiphosphoundecaprenol N-acetyl-beta-D-mannosaminyltransferase